MSATLKSLVFSSAALVTAACANAQEGPLLGHEILGDGPEKVMVLHDWLGNANTWDPIKPYLDETAFTYVFIDVRGYGRSMDLSGEYTVDEISGDVLRLADHLGFDRFHYIGHSMNGMTGMRLAFVSPERIESLILVAPITATGYPATDDDRAFFSAIPHNPDVTAQAFAGLTGGRYLDAWGQQKASINIATSTEEAMQGYRAMVVDGGFAGDLRSSPASIPALVIAGRHDLPGVQPDYLQETIPRLLSDAEIVVFEESGHYPMDEATIALATAIEGFLDDR